MKYAASKAYISSRSLPVRLARGNTEPARCGSLRASSPRRSSLRRSEGGCVNVDRAPIKLFMQVTSVRPFSQIKSTGIKDMGVRLRNRQERVAGIQPDQEIAEPSQTGQIVDLTQQTAENSRIIMGNTNESGIGAAKFVSRAGQSASSEPARAGIPQRNHSLEPTRIASHHRLFIGRLVPQTGYANNLFASARDSQVFNLQAKCGQVAQRQLGPNRKELAMPAVGAQEIDEFRRVLFRSDRKSTRLTSS